MTSPQIGWRNAVVLVALAAIASAPALAGDGKSKARIDSRLDGFHVVFHVAARSLVRRNCARGTMRARGAPTSFRFLP
jgi:hypothetical protein